MVAKIAGFHTRADLGLARPRSISRNITPGAGGVALHYGGGPVWARTHDDCVRTWRNWQAFHMRAVSLGGRGWTDIAYTGGFCQHGYAMAGRGAGIRTGANGTNFGNQHYYAATWIAGEGEAPTPAALDAADWWISELRRAGGAGRRVVPHRYFKSTACPGGHLAFFAATRNNRDVPGHATLPPTWGPYTDKDDMWYSDIIASYGEAGYDLTNSPAGRRHWGQIRVWGHHVYNLPVEKRDAEVRNIRAMLGLK